jgi:LPXTG-motif cell wall-anchored protein
MEFPHWLMVAGAVLVTIGSIGVAFRRKSDPKAKI